MTTEEFQPVHFGKYFLVQTLHSGRYSQIYKAKTLGAKGFEKNILLHEIKSQALSSQFITELTDEFQRVVKIAHANVLPFYDFGSVKDQYFFTQEYLEGLTLREYLQFKKKQSETLLPAEALYIVSEVLKGLQAIHTRFKGAQRLVHGHIQPQTVFISRDGEVKITGLGYERLALKFGVSDLVDEQYTIESWQRTGVWDSASDLKMCALILFELLTQKPLLKTRNQDLNELQMSREFFASYFEGDFLDFFETAFLNEGAKSFSQALDMAISIQRILYSRFPHFSAQHLVLEMAKKFPEASRLIITDHTNNSSVLFEETLKNLMKSSREQINLVHREGTELSALMADTVALSPEMHAVFTETKTIHFQPMNSSEPEQKWESKEVLSPSEEIEVEADDVQQEMWRIWPKSIKKIWAMIFITSICVVMGGVYLLVKHSFSVGFKPVDQVSQPTYQLVLNSQPDGAEIVLNGVLQNQLTPYTFTTMYNNTSYQILVRKTGFEEFSTILKNELGKDQILNVTLRPL